MNAKFRARVASAKRQKRSQRTEKQFIESDPPARVIPPKRGRFNKLLLPKVEEGRNLGNRLANHDGSLWRFDPIFRSWVEVTDLSQPHRVIVRFAMPKKASA